MSILQNYQTLAFSLFFVVLSLVIWGQCHQKIAIYSVLQRLLRIFSSAPKTPAFLDSEAVDIEPLLDFDIWSVEPVRYRPYKTQGHVTMGIMKRTRNDWIHMDRGYLERIRDRTWLIQNKVEFTIGTGPLVNHAIEELFTEIMVVYLPRRYPTMFKIKEDMVQNLVTGGMYPCSASDLTPEMMLQFLGTNVEEDFYIMCPDKNDGEFRLRGYVACFPGGFLSPARVGESVREIHQPVPGYEEKLGRSVDRYFARMKPGQFIGRMNWSLQVDGDDLFRTDGNNYYPGQENQFGAEKVLPSFSSCFLRVEHQTLVALPKSGAIIFCVRSYMTKLEDIKREGDGNLLADAIESMPEKLGMYKMRHFWGEKVLPWLRAE